MKKTEIDLINNFLKKDSCILAAYLFGSQAKGKSNKYSDIDIAVLFDHTVKEGYMDKQIKIMNNLSRVLNKEIDVIVLNKASLFLRYHVLKEGIKIYERCDRNEHNFEAQAIIQYLDFLPIKNRIENGLLLKIRGG
jgi:hypothetical protein